jgi:hypothetical protein
MKFLWKLDNNVLPSYLSECLTKVNEKQSYNLRSGNNYALPHFLKRCSQNSLFYKGLNMFNQLKIENDLSDINKFSRACHTFVKNNSDKMYIHGNIVN